MQKDGTLAASGINTCIFCNKFGDTGSQKRDPVFDKILCKNDSFLVVPAMGSLVPGYLLILTRGHFTSMARLPPEMLRELTRLKDRVRDRLQNSFGPLVFFEHGMICSSNNAGNSIGHAHMHAVPFRGDLLGKILADHDALSIRNFDDIIRQYNRNHSYVFFEDQNGNMYIIDDANVPSQYVRRLLAEDLGRPGKWDWAVCTFPEHAHATINELDNL